jgi:hypothetical protein
MQILRYIAIPVAAIFGAGFGAAPALADTSILLADDMPQPPSDTQMLNEIGRDIAATTFHAVHADDVDDVIVSDEVLSKQRGGFAIGGLNITLGADIKTFINNELALHTTMLWSDQAVSQTQVLSGALSMADAAMLRDQVLASGNISMQIGTTPVYLTNNGQTAISHRTDGALQNILVNTASNVDIRQEVNATLEVGGYAGFATSIQNEQLTNNFGESINNAIVTFGR